MIDFKKGDTKFLIARCRRLGVSLPLTAYLLATAWHETNTTMKPVREAYWLSEAWRAKNLRYFPYYGRGYVQLTWKTNYRRLEEATGLPLVNRPDLAMETEAATTALIEGSLKGWYTGKKLGDYINDRKIDYVNARRVINGTDDAQLIAGYAKEYLVYLEDLYEIEDRPKVITTKVTNPFLDWLRSLTNDQEKD